MSEKVYLNKQGFERRSYLNSIDTSFTQLIPPPPPVVEETSIEEFFILYNTLFYEIPATGTINSHTFLIERSSEYIGFTEEKDEDIQVLLNEITNLRQELLDTQQQVLSLQTPESLPDQSQTTSLIDEDLTAGTGLY
jgi:hypothetical protein|tara:strand:+ start:1078 stop:1488 length:411 start_codon:yes stop_codon:yes gene_type:complete